LSLILWMLAGHFVSFKCVFSLIIGLVCFPYITKLEKVWKPHISTNSHESNVQKIWV